MIFEDGCGEEDEDMEKWNIESREGLTETNAIFAETADHATSADVPVRLRQMSERKRKQIQKLATKCKLNQATMLREVLEQLPPDITYEMMRFAFVDKVLTYHKGNLAATARELKVSYRTICHWYSGNFPTNAEPQGRMKAGRNTRKVKNE